MEFQNVVILPFSDTASLLFFQPTDMASTIFIESLEQFCLIILKSDKHFNKNVVLKNCHLAPFLIPPDFRVLTTNQYSYICRELSNDNIKPHYIGIREANSE